MKAIRVVAVGLLMAMALMMNYAQEFFVWWLSSATFHSWAMAISTAAPPLSNIAGLHLVGAAAFSAGSLGVGLLLSISAFGALDAMLGAIRHMLEIFLSNAGVHRIAMLACHGWRRVWLQTLQHCRRKSS